MEKELKELISMSPVPAGQKVFAVYIGGVDKRDALYRDPILHFGIFKEGDEVSYGPINIDRYHNMQNDIDATAIDGYLGLELYGPLPWTEEIARWKERDKKHKGRDKD